MNKETIQTEAQIATPVTITVDLNQLIKSEGYLAGTYNPELDDYATGGGLALLVAKMLAERLHPEMKKAVIELVKDAAKDQVSDVIHDVMIGQVQLTNSYGESIGKFTTLREQIVASVTEQLNRKVNSRGGNETSYSRDGIPYVRWVAKQAASDALRGELNTAVQDAVAEVKQSVTDLVTAELGKRVAKAIIP